MTKEVVDTNVILVANGQHADVSGGCVVTCALRLQDIMKNKHLVIDADFLILKEYVRKITPNNGNRTGNKFVKWAFQNNANTRRVDCVALTSHLGRTFETFPDDCELVQFDPPDRKFVAVAAGHPERPPILQATDSKWLSWEEALKRHHVTVDFLCPVDIQRFHDNKTG